MNLPDKLAFVDIETTGSRFPHDRIIEIGIIRVEDNHIVHTYNQLLNPERYLPPEIEMLTGISVKDLQDQPTFHEVKQTIYDLLSDCLFVAHNARFDYGFLKHEFIREEMQFAPKHCCTVKLSRCLFPSERHHNLDAVMHRMALSCEKRHRAYSDAYLLYQFYKKIQHLFPTDQILEALKVAMNKPSLPSNLDPHIVDQLPEQPGVYIFYGSQVENNTPEKNHVQINLHNGTTKSDGSPSISNNDLPLIPLYVGKSKNIKERVLSHFAANIHSSTEMQLSQQVRRIETIPTVGELGALFTEANLIKKLLPLYNKQLRRQTELIALYRQVDPDGYPFVRLEVLTRIDPNDLDSFIGFFRSKKQAKNYLSRMVKEHQLCDKLVGLEKTTTSCFSYRLGICRGACIGKEPVLKYLIRFLSAFSALKIKPWPFKGPIAIEEMNIFNKHKELFIVDKWCYIGNIKVDEHGVAKDFSYDYSFDLDTYNILRRHFNNKEHVGTIKSLSQLQISGINNHFA